MLRKKDIKAIEKINREVAKMGIASQPVTDAVKKVHHIALLTNDDTFLKATEGDFHGDLLGIKHSFDDSHPFKVYTDYGNTDLGFIKSRYACSMINDVVRDGKWLYRRHRNALLAKSADRDTPYGLRNRMAFFVGNLYGIVKKQLKANACGTQNFFLDRQGGVLQACRDRKIIKALQHGYFQAGYPSSLMYGPDSEERIAKNIRLGKRLGRTKKYHNLVHSLDNLAYK